jgi:hypothetical protein
MFGIPNIAMSRRRRQRRISLFNPFSQLSRSSNKIKMSRTGKVIGIIVILSGFAITLSSGPIYEATKSLERSATVLFFGLGLVFFGFYIIPFFFKKKGKTRTPIPKNIKNKVRKRARGACEWCRERVELDFHHKDNDPSNHSMDNVVLICPNCHRGIHAAKD